MRKQNQYKRRRTARQHRIFFWLRKSLYLKGLRGTESPVFCKVALCSGEDELRSAQRESELRSAQKQYELRSAQKRDLSGVKSFNYRGGVYDQGVYECESKDIDERTNLVKPEVYYIDLAQLGVVRNILLGRVSSFMRALRTNGNGACGMHALFGTPVRARTSGYEFYVPDARDLAAQYLGPSLDHLEQRAGIQPHVHAIKTNFWDGYVVAHFQGPQTNESESFWRCLSLQSADLAEEAVTVLAH